MPRRSGREVRGLIFLAAALAAVLINASCAHPVPAPAYSLQPPDTVPNKVSCQFRGASFCHPRKYDI